MFVYELDSPFHCIVLRILYSLGFFKFSEKSRQKCIIEEADKKLDAAKSEIEKAEEEYKNSGIKLGEYLDDKKKSIQSQVWNELPLPTPGDLPDLGIKPISLGSPALTGRDSLPLGPPWKPFLEETT